ncbi:hypothetical protein FNV43_RR19866 [Rhamnella rubrinervis]|uniref:Uncharacterized protein n=1 Tax=Rhamnella rubrinervis TaxID=2594499 RepID=A0A8K0GU28_9ROSA|nr:hypothetical protein FNV43_RR19866 [Rhamnella rubrinervis]
MFAINLLLFSLCAINGDSAAVDETINSNPLLQDIDFPLFNVVEAKCVGSRIHTLLKKLVRSLLF